MKRSPSLTLRLTLLFNIVAIIVFSSFGWIMERSIEKHFEQGDRKELELISEAVEPLLRSLSTNQNFSQIKQRIDDILVGHHHPLLCLLYAKEQIYCNPELSKMLPKFQNKLSKENILQDWNNGNNHYRILIKIRPIYRKPFYCHCCNTHLLSSTFSN